MDGAELFHFWEIANWNELFGSNGEYDGCGEGTSARRLTLVLRGRVLQTRLSLIRVTGIHRVSCCIN